METESKRASGILMHISSLPNRYGIGSLGKEAYGFVDFLAKSHVKYWQILPLAQTGFGDSPYQSVCANSGNPYFIDLEGLKEDGLLDGEELESAVVPEEEVDYAALYESRYNLLRLAYARFDIKDKHFVKFIESGEFEDYALFMSLKSRYGGTFDAFPDAYKYKEHLAIFEFRRTVYKSDYCFWLFLQYIFRKQWLKLKQYANLKGVKIIGDLPLYVAYDSSDVWGRPELFALDEELKPVDVAGVPPDYFSQKGQLWGNPLYNWDAMKAENYDWWIKRMASAAKMYDVIRIDHFRGFDRYYAIPADSETAERGRWLPGPGLRFFEILKRRLGDVRIIAEDLGEIDAGVVKLRARTGYPGMKILQFAFDGKVSNLHLPANYDENCVVYTGTHDNDTCVGFIEKLDKQQYAALKKRLRASLAEEGVNYPLASVNDVAMGMVICAMASKADLAVIPLQDLLLLGGAARMNLPSSREGNWRFRIKEMPTRINSAVMRKMVKHFGR